MANESPFNELAGLPLTVYIAAASTAAPAVNATPGGSWTELGETDGDQSVETGGAVTEFRNNKYSLPIKAIRPDEDVIGKFKLVNLTLENVARVWHNVSKVTSAAGPPSTRKIPLVAGHVVSEYALLFKHGALSPYGAFPGQYYFPRVYFAKATAITFNRSGRAELDAEFHALSDSTQPAGEDGGIWIVQDA